MTRVSFDLIYARPGQSAEAWQERAWNAHWIFGTAHLSLYQLTIEPGTRFETLVRHGKFTPLDDDEAADLFALTRELTAAAGLPPYEISNHARPGEESRHNLTYWRYEDYCGIGPGAHGRRGGMATVRHKKPENWLAPWKGGLRDQGRARARHSRAGAEALLMGLRLAEGIAPDALAERLGMTQAKLLNAAAFERYAAQGLSGAANALALPRRNAAARCAAGRIGGR